MNLPTSYAEDCLRGLTRSSSVVTVLAYAVKVESVGPAASGGYTRDLKQGLIIPLRAVTRDGGEVRPKFESNKESWVTFRSRPPLKGVGAESSSAPFCGLSHSFSISLTKPLVNLVNLELALDGVGG